jgi:SNF2 family DNA or RNA helicase
MPARLREEADLLVLKLGGDAAEFQHQKAAAKTIAGYRYDPKLKAWCYRNDDETLIALANRVEPEMPKTLEARVQNAAAEQAEQLVTTLPDDADLLLPWADRLAPKQRAGIDFMARHPHAILADEMGAGKSVESIATVYEYLLRCNQHATQGPNSPQGVSASISTDAQGAVARETQAMASTESSASSEESARSNSEISREDQADHHGSKGQAVRGLRDATASRADGPGSRSRNEDVQPGTVDEATKAEGLDVDGGNQGGDSEVRGSVPELSSTPAPRVLIVCLNAAVGHWQREIKKWCGADSTIISGGPKERADELKKSADWTIINVEKLALMITDLKKVKWDAVIADEAHSFKNYKAKRTKALLKLKAPVQIAASGTPIMNSPAELFPLLKWAEPEAHTSYWAFFYTYCEFYEGARNRKIITGVKNADQLRFVLANKLVRRTKREIHPEIPEPFDPIIYEPEMKEEQAKLYKAAVTDFWLEVAQDIPDADREEAASIVESGDLAPLMLMIPNAAARTVRLRQIATSPSLVGGVEASGKLDEIERLVLDGGIDRPWVWFAWFRDSVDLLVSRFQNMGIEAHGFRGGEGERPDELAQSFQAGEFPIIVATIRSGGQSIELQNASDCGFAEEEYVPGINQQAFDRIDRMGQLLRPQRHIVRTPGTVETGKIAPAQGTKKLIVTTILGG